MIKTLALDTPNIKITDNDTPIYLTPYNDGMLATDETYTPTVYVASSDSAFTKSIPAVWSGDKVYVMSSTLADLPVGTYDVEVWLTKDAEQLIYPDYGYVKLNINQTVAGINANLISSVTVAEFRDMFNSLATDINTSIAPLAVDSEVVHNTGNETVAGTKTFSSQIISLAGVRGPVDNAGLISAPAFQSLQTQVNNSAVGINLALGTSNRVVQASSYKQQVADIKYEKSLGDNLSASVMINNADNTSGLTHGDARIDLQTYDSGGNTLATVSGNSIRYDANGLSQCSISIDDSIAGVKAYIVTNYMNVNAYYSAVKIEKGTKATDWCPNPADVPSNDAQLVHKTGNETVAGTKTFSSPIFGSVTGNAGTSTKLATARTINNVPFDGTANISVNAANDASLVHQAVGTVIMNSSSTASGESTGTWSNIGSATIGSTVVYYWKRTA